MWITVHERPVERRYGVAARRWQERNEQDRLTGNVASHRSHPRVFQIRGWYARWFHHIARKNEKPWLGERASIRTGFCTSDGTPSSLKRSLGKNGSSLAVRLDLPDRRMLMD
jgi:hypothetical protein